MSKFDRLKDLAREEEEVELPVVSKKKNRRLGLANDPEWEQTTVYIKVEVKIKTQKKLLGTKVSLSSLMNTLLEEWLET